MANIGDCVQICTRFSLKSDFLKKTVVAIIRFFFGGNLPIAGSESGFWADFDAVLPGDRPNTSLVSYIKILFWRSSVRITPKSTPHQDSDPAMLSFLHKITQKKRENHDIDITG